ncbi:hypothetical protein ACVB9K_01365 [Streptococcus infantarius]
MAKYKAAKNLFFRSLNKSVMVDETIELDKEYADHVNADLAKAFPDVEKVLVPLEEEPESVPEVSEEETAVEPKKARRGKKAKTEE